MDISEEALKFIQETPLAREILLLLTKDPNTFFMHSTRNGPQAGVISSTDGLYSSEYPNTYTGERATEAWAVLENLDKLGVLKSLIAGCGSPFFYCVAEERFDNISCENQTPEIRQGLRKLLN